MGGGGSGISGVGAAEPGVWVWFCASETREGPRREGAFGRNGEASRSDSVPREPGSGWVKGFLKKTEQEVDTLPQLSFIHSPGTVDAVQCTQLRGPVSSIVP